MNIYILKLKQMDNIKIILKSRPNGWVTEDNFAIIKEKIELKDKSKVLV